MVDAINVANADSDSDDPFGLTSSKSRRQTDGQKSRRKEFVRQMKRPGSATFNNKEDFILIDGIRTENRVVVYEETEEEKKQHEREQED